MAVIEPSVVILASRFDLACDYVVASLRRRGFTYVRLNTEDLSTLRLTIDPAERVICGEGEALRFEIGRETLKAIFYRRAVASRDTGSHSGTSAEQLSRTQWAAFTRGFMMFEAITWMNHPQKTYLAENKVFQLAAARDVGFQVPPTIVTNDALRAAETFDGRVAVKGVDTVLMAEGDVETFAFTNLMDTDELGVSSLNSAPVIVQAALERKLDLRVTVVGDKTFTAAITEEGGFVSGDWRLRRERVAFEAFDLPAEIQRLCVQYSQSLGLSFAGIDLALQDGSYYFLEVNPTGEWAWLVDQAGLPIDEAIAGYLSG